MREVGGAMPSSDWSNDDALLAELSEAAGASGDVSDRILASARAAFAWRDIDADLALAHLTYDSVLAEMDGALAMRGAQPEGPRMLVFEGPGCTVEIEVSDRGIVGQLIPPGRGHVDLLTRDGEAGAVTTDDVGCFTFNSPPAGPLRLRCSIGDAAFVTEWIIV